MKLDVLIENLRIPEDEKISLRQAFHNAARHIERVHTSAGQFAQSLDFDKIASKVLSAVCELLGAVGSSLWLLEDDDTLICKAVSGQAKELVYGWKLEPGQGIAGWVIQHDTYDIVSDVREDTRHFGEVDQCTRLGIRSMVSVPLRVQSRIIGVLQVVDTTVGRFTEADLVLLDTLADAAASALENASLYTRLEQTNHEKDKLFSIIAHDLASPFAAIMAYADLMNLGIDTITKEQIASMSGELVRVVRNAQNLLNNLLKWSVSQLGRIPYVPCTVALAPLIERILQLFSIQAADKKLTVTNAVPKHCHVRTDADMLETILRNFISNAVKFTPESGEIRIFIKSHTKAIEICVADTGIGLSEERQKTLFALGNTGPTRGTNNERGSGLGLGLCRDLAHACDAVLAVTSTKGNGSIFSIRLPLE